MNLAEDAADDVFRVEVSEFLKNSLSAELRMRADGAQLSTRKQTLT